MSWDKVKSVVGAVAPNLATALGGPLAGMAVREIAGQWLDKPDATEAEVERAILNATPEQLAELKRIDRDFRVKMKELDINLEEVHQKDRVSARELAARTSILPQIILSTVFVTGYMVVLIGLLTAWLKIPTDDSGLIVGIIGVLTAGVVQVMNYWLGSSKGSSDKTAMAAISAHVSPLALPGPK